MTKCTTVMKTCERHIMHQSNRLQLSLFSCLTRNKRSPGIGWSLKGDFKRLFLALSGTANDGGGGPGGGQRAARADAELAAGRGPEPRHPGVRALHPDHGQPGQHRLPGGHQGMSVPDSFFLHTHFGKRGEGGSGNYIFWLGGARWWGFVCMWDWGGGGAVHYSLLWWHTLWKESGDEGGGAVNYSLCPYSCCLEQGRLVLDVCFCFVCVCWGGGGGGVSEILPLIHAVWRGRLFFFLEGGRGCCCFLV